MKVTISPFPFFVTSVPAAPGGGKRNNRDRHGRAERADRGVDPARGAGAERVI